MTLDLLIDDRERCIIGPIKYLLSGKFAQHKIKCKVVRLNAADFVISYRGHILCMIERKTLPDLSNTIKDPVRKMNYKKMLDRRKSSEFYFPIYYLIQGHQFVSPDTKIAKIAYSTLVAHLDHLSINYGIQITRSPRDATKTAYRILELCKNVISSELIKKIDVAAADVAGGNVNIAEELTRPIKMPYHRAKIQFFASFPKISQLLAAVFVKYKVCAAKLLLGDYTLEFFEDKRYPSGKKLGGHINNVIAAASTLSAQQQKKIIRSIPSIGDITARSILAKVTLYEIAAANGDKKIFDNKNIKIGAAQKKNIYEFIL